MGWDFERGGGRLDVTVPWLVRLGCCFSICLPKVWGLCSFCIIIIIIVLGLTTIKGSFGLYLFPPRERRESSEGVIDATLFLLYSPNPKPKNL